MRSAFNKPFHYRAVVHEGDIREGEVFIEASGIPPVSDGRHHPDDKSGEYHYSHLSPERRHLGLVGPTPRLRFWQDRMNLISPSPHSDSLTRWCGFTVGDVIERAARIGDEIQAYRTVWGGVSLALFREGRVVAAVGDLMGAEVDCKLKRAEIDFHVSCVPAGVVQIGGIVTSIGTRESARIGAYDVYVETWPERSSIYDSFSASSLSIALAEDPVIVNSARRSAVLMRPHADDSLYGELTDGTFIRRLSEIP